MPDGGDKLPDADLKAIADWIDLGAAYDAPLAGKDDAAPAPGEKTHWAFRPVGAPDSAGACGTPPAAATRSTASSWRSSKPRD